MKNVIYFENINKDTTLKTFINKDFESRIRKTDAISVSVSSISPETFVYNNGQAGILDILPRTKVYQSEVYLIFKLTS